MLGFLVGGGRGGVGDLLGGGGCGVGDLLGDGVDAALPPTQCHRTEHYDDLAIEQLDLGWGRICYKKGMTYYYEQIVNYLSQYKLMM